MPNASNDADSLRLRFWGVRGSIPTPQPAFMGVGGNTACVEVRAPDSPIVVLDAGTGVRELGHSLAWAAPDGVMDVHVLLTHYHWDHIQGLPFFAPLYGPRCRVTIYGWEADGSLESHLQGQMKAPYFPVGWDTVPAEVSLRALRPGQQVQLGALTVDPFELHHTQPTLGFRIEAHGATAVFATDHEHGDERYDDSLRESAAGAGVLICDAQYTPEEYEARRGWGHTTWREAVGFAEEAGAARVALFHHDPTHDDAALAQVLEEASAVSPRVFLASEGQEVRL